MRVAVAGIPGAWSTERMCDALRREGIDAITFSLGDCVHDLSAGRVTLEGLDLATMDGIVVKKLGAQEEPLCRLRLHALRELEAHGVRIYNRPSAIDAVMDRYRMTMRLVAEGFPVPSTLHIESGRGLQEALAQLGDALLKPIYTSKGRGMTRASASRSGSAEAACWDGRPVLVQRFIEGPGRDIGACVLGGRFIGAFYRIAANGAWLTSTSAGGSYAPCELPPPARDLAERAAVAFGLDYTIVDLVEIDDGYALYEASAFGGFRGLWDACKQDVAEAYARYVKWDILG